MVVLCVGASSPRAAQDHSWVAEYAMLAPGSVLPAFSYIPPGQVWAGNPARYIRDATDDEKVRPAREHRLEPFGAAWNSV